jgi:glyoxylase-like metal-dependent hydrolase (beta-lactamase superfamily II)
MKRLGTIAALIFIVGTASAQTKLQMKTYTASADGFLVTSTLIYGQTDAALIDGQFTLSDAHRLAAMILETKKNLGIIYVTHWHPDHYFGLSVLKETFPSAKIVALPGVIDEIKASAQAKVQQWGPMYGTNLTSTPIIPEPLDGTSINLEGETLQIVGNVQGDAEHNSYVWIPSLQAIITGDIVFNGVYPWTLEATRAQRKGWIKALDRISELKPVIVVAGHKKPESPDDASAVEFTKNYLLAYEAALSSSKTADELIGKMKTKFPNLSLDIILKIAASAVFPTPTK